MRETQPHYPFPKAAHWENTIKKEQLGPYSRDAQKCKGHLINLQMLLCEDFELAPRNDKPLYIW